MEDFSHNQVLFFVLVMALTAIPVGFFAGLFGGGRSNDEIIEVNYRILVESVKENVEVRLVDSKGNSLPKAESLKLLAIVRSNLS